ncbi:Phage Tail Collar [Oleispira antarctica RB-8]|uniref:Phage Tail Collar n=1 Tax=Oleispira antarctica RB-8 TaxID=698738 RepID=R4YR87_OLEAN|nr:Phage Tail Collar [Oleispira antarctica RB-8]
MSDPFIAEIRMVACNFAPRSWAECNGQILPIAQNTALFALIGTNYGGDGRTTMGLPDLQGRSPMHPGNGPGLSSRRLGEKVNASPSTTNIITSVTVDRGLAHTETTEQVIVYPTAGANGIHNHAALGLKFLIALQGLFPSRS